MTDAQPPGRTGPRPAWESTIRPEVRRQMLADHFMANVGSHTPEALGRTALAAGYTQEEVDAAIASLGPRLAAAEASAPTRKIAQQTILALYALTYLLFAIVFLTQSFSYGIGVIALIILTGVLGLALGLSALWARRRTWRERGASVSIAAILSLPIVLLVLVAGTCAYTTFPGIR
jgi:hypothetical protein